MAGGGGLGTTWCLATALEHIERIERRDKARSLHLAIRGADLPLPDKLELPRESASAVQRGARDSLLMALRDGYIRATGRLSTTPALFPWQRTGRSWRLHASDPSLITTTEWRTGELAFSPWQLTSPSWQYIQIEVPAFMVKAMWPDEVHVAESATSCAAGATYTTPYLELMNAAISRFGLTAECQSKKENLSDWFFEQQVEGEPISRNLANAMATLCRLPSAQRGGARRVIGPDLRRAG